MFLIAFFILALGAWLSAPGTPRHWCSILFLLDQLSRDFPVLFGPIKGKDERRLAVRLFFVLNEKFARSELSSQEKAAQGVFVTFLVVTKDLRSSCLREEG